MSLKPFPRIENPVVRRVAQYAADLIVLTLVVNISLKFVDPKQRLVAVLFILASACGALKQLTAWRAGQRQPGIISRFKHGWALVAVIAWFAATYPESHQLFQSHMPQMPLSLQVTGAACLIFAGLTPFLRIGDLTRRVFDAYPQAIGSVLLTGSPLVALLVAAWIGVMGRAAWQALRTDRLAAAAQAVCHLRAA
jgi:hypothetical protein